MPDFETYSRGSRARGAVGSLTTMFVYAGVAALTPMPFAPFLAGVAALAATMLVGAVWDGMGVARRTPGATPGVAVVGGIAGAARGLVGGIGTLLLWSLISLPALLLPTSLLTQIAPLLVTAALCAEISKRNIFVRVFFQEYKGAAPNP